MSLPLRSVPLLCRAWDRAVDESTLPLSAGSGLYIHARPVFDYGDRICPRPAPPRRPAVLLDVDNSSYLFFDAPHGAAFPRPLFATRGAGEGGGGVGLRSDVARRAAHIRTAHSSGFSRNTGERWVSSGNQGATCALPTTGVSSKDFTNMTVDHGSRFVRRQVRDFQLQLIFVPEPVYTLRLPDPAQNIHVSEFRVGSLAATDPKCTLHSLLKLAMKNGRNQRRAARTAAL
ncbi:hypothetical protein VTK56DRAFT_10109 [Thermocarpiscus australiensis]